MNYGIPEIVETTAKQDDEEDDLPEEGDPGLKQGAGLLVVLADRCRSLTCHPVTMHQKPAPPDLRSIPADQQFEDNLDRIAKPPDARLSVTDLRVDRDADVETPCRPATETTFSPAL